MKDNLCVARPVFDGHPRSCHSSGQVSSLSVAVRLSLSFGKERLRDETNNGCARDQVWIWRPFLFPSVLSWCWRLLFYIGNIKNRCKNSIIKDFFDLTFQRCYHHPRLYNEPCSAGFSCSSGLSCQPGYQRCLHHPRRENERCSAGYSCADGLVCRLCDKPFATCQLGRVPALTEQVLIHQKLS